MTEVSLRLAASLLLEASGAQPKQFAAQAQYWKSNPMFWCEYCKVWMQDKPSARATHEKGIKHKDNVARSKSPRQLLMASSKFLAALSWGSCRAQGHAAQV